MLRPLIGIGSDVTHVEGKKDRVFAPLSYVEALRSAGAIPVILPPQPESAAALLERLDGVLLAGGADCNPAEYGEAPHPSVEPMDPRRQANDVALARAAHALGIPALGICLGMQMMNVAAGGTLIQDIDSQHPTDIRHTSTPEVRARHDVTIEAGTGLSRIIPPGTVNVNSSHHQAVGRMADGFRRTAFAPDGIPEGLEDPRRDFYAGVQWHPEDMPGEASASALFAAFVEAARAFAQARRQATVLSPAASGASE